MMRILERKGHVAVSRVERTHVYRATSTRQRVLRRMARDFVDRVFDGSAESLVQHLIRDNRLSADDLRKIARHLTRKKGGDD